MRTSGLLSRTNNTNPNGALPGTVDDNLGDGYTNGTGSRSGGSNLQRAEDVARLVFKFVEAAGVVAEGLEPGAGNDDVKLVRLRTKKNELVIVPSKFSRTCFKVFRVATDTDRREVLARCRTRNPSSLSPWKTPNQVAVLRA